MSTLKLSPWFRQQFFDGAGNPLAGGLVNFYVAGSGTLRKTTWEDYLGSAENPNPVVLDSEGVAKIFGSGIYDVVITDADGVLIETVRGVDFGGSSAGGEGTSIIVDNYNALRALTEDYDLVYVLGRTTPGDGGQGWFQLTSGTDPDDDGIVLIRGESSHYYRNLADYIDPRWYGVVYGTTADQSASVAKAFTASVTWDLPVLYTGSVYISSKTTVPSGARLIGHGTFHGPAGSPVEMLFKAGSHIDDGGLNLFAVGVKATFEQGVTDALRLSWFTDGTDTSRWTKVASCSTFGYSLLVDIDTSISGDISIPANFAVDFIGGSKITVTAASDIFIGNMVYNGIGQIVQYKDIAYVGDIHLGTGYSYLEWFGGVASASLDTDNSIPWLACIKHGRVYLLADTGYYNVPAGTYATSGSVDLAGTIALGVVGRSVDTQYPSTLRFSGAATTIAGNLTVSSVKIDGYGSLTCAGLSTDNTVISNTLSVDTGLAAATDSLTIDPQYVLVGGNGKVIVSSDLTNWSNETVSGVFSFSSVAYSGSQYVAVGAAGAIYTSDDTDVWTSRTSGTTKNFTKVIYANSKFVAVGAEGVVSYSVDGVTWTTSTIATADLYDIAWFSAASLWVAVGSGATVKVSSDLAAWNSRTITGLTGIIYSVGASTETVVIAGTGFIYTSSDAGTWYGRLAPTASILMTTKYYADKKLWVAGTSSGQIVTSSDAISWALASMNITSTDTIYCQTEVNGKIVLGTASGYVLVTGDCKTFTKTQPINAAANYGIASRTGRVIAIGAAGAISQSEDMFSWTAQTPATAANLSRAKQVNGVYYALGDGGTYIYSRDGVHWTEKNVGGSYVLKDLAVNDAKTLYTMVAEDGMIYTSADPLAGTVVWASRTSGVATDLLNVVYTSSAWYAYGVAGTILRSTDGSTWTNISVSASAISSNGIISNGTITVYYGANGGILSTTDGSTYAKRTSGTTVNLLGGAYGNSTFVICGQNGTILTSTDGVTWTNRTSGTSSQLNHVEFASGTFVACGSATAIIKSTDGISWANAFVTYNGGSPSALTNNWKSVRHYNMWYVCGDGGGIMYCGSDLSNWNSVIPQYGTPITDPPSSHTWIDLIGSDDGTGNWAVGSYDANGYTIMTSNWGEARWFRSPFTPASGEKFTKTFGNMILGESGVMYRYDGCGRPSPDFLGPVAPVLVFTKLYSDTTDNLVGGTMIGANYRIVSNYASYDSTDQVTWTEGVSAPSGDLRSVVIDGTTTYVLSSSALYSTSDSIIFDKVKDVVGNAFEKVGTDYYILEADSIVEKATTVSETGFERIKLSSVDHNLISAGAIQINGADFRYFLGADGKILVGSASGMTLTSSKSADINDSVIDVPVACTDAGTVAGSKLVSVGSVGTLSDTTITAMTGSLAGNVSRSSITTYESIGVTKDISVVDSKLVQETAGYDLLSQSSTVSAITLTNCDIRLKGLLLYSENADLVVNLYGGFIDSTYALTNGFAKIYINSVSKPDGAEYKDVSAYSINGSVFEGTTLAPSEVLTSALTGWYHEKIANVGLDATTSSLKVTADLPVCKGHDSVYTLRFRKATTAIELLYELGGKIRLDVTFPTGYDKDKQAKIKLRPVLYTPEYVIVSHLTMIGSRSFGFAPNNTGLSNIGSSFAGSTRDAAKVSNVSYLWSGRRELLLASDFGDPLWDYDRWNDRYGINYKQDGYNQNLKGIHEYSKTADVYNYAPYIVIEAEDNCVLPANTLIKITVEPVLPSVADMQVWLGDLVDTTLDPINNLEFRTLVPVEINSDDINLKTVRNISSSLIDEQVYLGVNYTWTYGGTSWFQNPDPAYIYPALSNLGKNIRIDVEGLAPNTIAAIPGTTSYLFTKGHYRQTSKTAFSLMAEAIIGSIPHPE